MPNKAFLSRPLPRRQFLAHTSLGFSSLTHGATDELGFHAVENRHYVTDIHATLMHLLGVDARQLELPGRKRLDIDYGTPIREIIA